MADVIVVDDAAGYSFVSVGELKDYMSGIGLDVDQAAAAQDVLDGLQRELERHCQRRFERKERTETLIPDDFGRIWPKATPVVSVTAPFGLSVIAGGNGVAGPAFGFMATYPVVLTYVGGLDPDGDDLHDVRIAILRAAAREVTDRHDDTLSIKDLDGRDAPTRDKRDLGFTEKELAKFDRLRRRTVV